MASDAGEFLDKALSDEEKKKIIDSDKKMTEYFRRVFTTHDGRIVLEQILIDLKFFSECVTETDIALNNYAKFMIFKRLKCDNTKEITNNLLNNSNITREETNG